MGVTPNQLNASPRMREPPSEQMHKGYPPHDAGVDEGEAEVSHECHRSIEALEQMSLNHHHTHVNKTPLTLVAKASWSCR